MALPNVFSPGQVFTAANANLLRSNQYNQTVTNKTASYTPTTNTDIGTRVIMNSASATTITINTSIYAAGDTLFLSNIGVGVCTLTAGTCSITSAGPLAIPQYGGGILYFTSASAAIYYPSAGAAVSSGLSFIAKATFTAVANVNILNCFSSSYTHYSLRLSNFIGGGVTTLRFGTAGTPDTGLFYQNSNVYIDSSSVAGGTNANYNASSANLIGNGYAAPGNTLFAEFSSPFETVGTTYVSQGAGSFTAGTLIIGTLNQGRMNTSTSYTDLQLLNSAGSMSGTYSIYGYAQS